MNRTQILAGGAVVASLMLCGGAVTMANALSSIPVSQVLSVAGVSTTPSATPSATEVATPTADPTPTASSTPQPGDGSGGVTVVAPADPSKIDPSKVDGKGCGQVAKHPTGVATTDQTTPHPTWTGTPAAQDPDSAFPHWAAPGPHYPAGGAWRPGGGFSTGSNGTGQN